MKQSPRRSDICWVAPDPTLGTEIKKTRLPSSFEQFL